MVLESYPVTTSLWGSATVAPGTALAGDIEADVVIVGAGLSGLSSGCYLRRADDSLRVVILEADHVGYGASGRNFGSVPQLARSDVSLITRLVGAEETRFIIDHQARMLDDFESLLEAESISCGFERSSVLLVAREPDTVSGLERLRQLHARYGFPSTLLDAGESLEYLNMPCHGALSCGRNGYVQPFQLAQGMARAATAAGVVIHEGSPVQGLTRTGAGVLVSTPHGSVTARCCVLCTNAFSPSLGAGVGWFYPTYTYVLATEPLATAQLEELGWSPEHRHVLDAGVIGSYYYMQLSRDGRLLIGGGGAVPSADGVTLARHDNTAEYKRIHRELARRFPRLAGVGIACAWGGPVAMTETGVPTTATVADGIVLNAGYNGRGVLMATLSGHIVVGEVLGEDRVDPDYLRYARGLLRVRRDEIKIEWS